MRFLVLGGYGFAGEALCSKLIIQHTDSEVVVAGRNLEKAEAFAKELGPDRARALSVDALEPESLKKALEEIDMVIVAATVARNIRRVAKTVLDAGTDYLDILYPLYRLRELRPISPEIEKKGRVFITEAGVHPSLASAIVRLAVERAGNPKMATVAMLMSLDTRNYNFGSASSISELAESLRENKSVIYRDGKWRKAGWKPVRVNFGPPFGERDCVFMDSPELMGLPDTLGLEELGLCAAGFNPFVDYLVMPLGLFITRWSWGIKLTSSLLAWGLKKFSRPPFGMVLMLEADGFRLTVQHQDPWFLTAASVVACLMQYVQGKIKPGFWMMGHAVESGPFFPEMKAMGVEISEETVRT